MLSLNIETSTNLTSVSLSEANGVRKILNVNSERPNHCELLVPLITESVSYTHLRAHET